MSSITGATLALRILTARRLLWFAESQAAYSPLLGGEYGLLDFVSRTYRNDLTVCRVSHYVELLNEIWQRPSSILVAKCALTRPANDVETRTPRHWKDAVYRKIRLITAVRL
jgi:hypothetical protein